MRIMTIGIDLAKRGWESRRRFPTLSLSPALSGQYRTVQRALLEVDRL